MPTARARSEHQLRILDAKAAEEQILEQSKRIEFYISEYSVEILAQKMRDGEYEVPSYQREFTWEADRKSRFIESLLMGLPIPFIFFWEMPDGRLEVVDGSQRLRTLEEFLLGNLRLGELEQLTHVSGFTFRELPESRQRKIKNRSTRGIILNEHADEAARFDMFDRINTGSKIANKAEVRRGALAGPFMDLVIELAQDPLFVELTPLSTKDVNEREREELVARFFAYGDGLQKYRDRPADFVFQYSKSANDEFSRAPELRSQYKERFDTTMGFIRDAFPNGFKRTPRSKTTTRARFEAIAIGASLALKEDSQLRARDPRRIDVDAWVTSPEFTQITGSDGANAVARLIGRMDFVRTRLIATAK